MSTTRIFRHNRGCNNKPIQQNSNCVKNDIILLNPIENDNDSNENDSIEDENVELFEDYSNFEETDSGEIDSEEMDSEDE